MKPDPSTPKRSIAKAVSWETFSNLVCFGLAYATFGNLSGCAIFTGICFVVKLILFCGTREHGTRFSGERTAESRRSP